MERLFIEDTEDTPFVLLDPENKTFVFAKKSLPENAFQFYQPIISWLEDYFLYYDQEAVFTFKFDYFNTSSAKQLLKILNILEEQFLKGKKIKIQWFHLPEDDDMKTSGQRFALICRITFEIIEYEPNSVN